MRTAVGVLGLALVALVLFEAFETIVVPRRVRRQWRIAGTVARLTWPAYRATAAGIRDRQRRETLLAYYGPGSLLFTIALWFGLIILGYALALWAFASSVTGQEPSLGNAAFAAASSVFTLGFGGASPGDTAGRGLAIAAGGTGFASLALLISYLPTLSQAFGRREVYISQLDARAGSPPTAGELLARNTGDGSDDVRPFLLAWEGWGADLLESLLSFPNLALYRSQHDNQSWLAALTAVLDTCTLVIVSDHRPAHRQAKLTYAMCRHAAVDLTRALGATPDPDVDRLDAAAYERLRARLATTEWHIPDDAREKLARLRAGYEPYVAGLSRELLMALPGWTAPDGAQDSWRLTEFVPTSRHAVRHVR
jgi:hypothetical protein